MAYSLFPHARAYPRDRRPAAAQQVVSPHTHPVLKSPFHAPDRANMRLSLMTIEQMLHSIDEVARDIVFAQAAPHDPAHVQHSARHAEAAMHRLLDLEMPQSATMTELSQSLTAVILAADMVVSGNFADAHAGEMCDMIVRNVQQALRAIVQLRAANGLPG